MRAPPLCHVEDHLFRTALPYLHHRMRKGEYNIKLKSHDCWYTPILSYSCVFPAFLKFLRPKYDTPPTTM